MDSRVRRTLRTLPATAGWFLLLVMILIPSRGETVDFRRMRPDPAPDLRQRIATRDPIRLWSGKAGRLQFELGRLNGRVLWVVADERSIHLSQGMQASFYPGTRVKRIQGEVLWIGFHSIPRRPSRALLTVFHRFGRQYRTTVFELRGTARGVSEGVLRARYRGDWQLIRPLGDWLFRQTLRPEELWQPAIRRLHTTPGGYRVGDPLSLPEGSRLIGTVLVPDQGTGSRAVSLDDGGNLALSRSGRVRDRREGDYGQGAVRLRARSPDHRELPLRIPPVYLPGRRAVAVAVNPPRRGGLQGWITGPGSSRIQVFGIDEDRLVPGGQIGPFPGRILDLEVPAANSEQLLWLRSRGRDRVTLEMIDLSGPARIDPE